MPAPIRPERTCRGLQERSRSWHCAEPPAAAQKSSQGAVATPVSQPKVGTDRRAIAIASLLFRNHVEAHSDAVGDARNACRLGCAKGRVGQGESQNRPARPIPVQLIRCDRKAPPRQRGQHSLCCYARPSFSRPRGLPGRPPRRSAYGLAIRDRRRHRRGGIPEQKKPRLAAVPRHRFCWRVP